MPYYDSGLDLGVNGIAAGGTRIALHTADPGSTGANEVAGTGRPATTWAAATSTTVGGKTARQRVGSQVSAPIPAGTTVTHWSLMAAATGGQPLYSDALPAPETFGSAGTLQVNPSILVANP